jgi:tryptophan synthase alpha chain
MSHPEGGGPPGNHGFTRAEKSLVIYLVCEPETPALAEAAVEGGADLLELGIPFSDPLAEGPTIRLASERALARGMRTGACIECIAEVRRRVETPLVPMTYAAILEAYGYDRFVADTRAAGATTAIVVDLPVEDHPEVPRIQLVAPTSTDERIAACAAASDGWLYLVSLTGTTGARDEVSPALAGLVERTRALTGLPLYAGFGISTPEQAATVASLADGVVVGSRAVQVAEEGPAALRDYVRSLREAIDA